MKLVIFDPFPETKRDFKVNMIGRLFKKNCTISTGGDFSENFQGKGTCWSHLVMFCKGVQALQTARNQDYHQAQALEAMRGLPLGLLAARFSGGLHPAGTSEKHTDMHAY